MYRRLAAITGMALVFVVAATGCRANERPGPSTSGSSKAPSTSALSAAERDAVAAYRGMWDAWVTAGKTSNPDEPALRTYTSGEALKLIVSVLLTNQHNQQVSRGEVEIDPKVVSSTPASAPAEVTISDCVNDEHWLMYKSSGGLVNDVPGGRHSMTATVSGADGTWKVTVFKLGRVGTC